MGKLNLKLGNVNEENKGLITGFSSDINSAIRDTSSSVSDILSPILVLAENTIDTVRHPIGNILNPRKKNGFYKKLLKFIPATTALAVTHAIDKPFATLEKAIEYGINNNVERVTESIKGVSTKLISNIITSNGKTKSKILRGLGKTVEGAGDLIGSAVKLPFWLTHKIVKAPRNIKGYGTQSAANWSTSLVKNLKFNEKNYIDMDLISNNANDNNVKSEVKVA